MDIYLKLSQLVHTGDFEQVKKILNNIHHPNKVSLEIQCICSAVACQRYDIVEYFMGGVPSYKDTAQFFKVAIRAQDHKMVDLLFQNKPNKKVCSEALLEAIKHDDLYSIKKLLPHSLFASDPGFYIAHAIELGCLHSVNYLLPAQPLDSATATKLLKTAIHVVSVDDWTAKQVLDTIVGCTPVVDLKNLANKYNRKADNCLILHLFDCVDILTQHQTITEATSKPPAQNKLLRKI